VRSGKPRAFVEQFRHLTLYPPSSAASNLVESAVTALKPAATETEDNKGLRATYAYAHALLLSGVRCGGSVFMDSLASRGRGDNGDVSMAAHRDAALKLWCAASAVAAAAADAAGSGETKHAPLSGGIAGGLDRGESSPAPRFLRRHRSPAHVHVHTHTPTRAQLLPPPRRRWHTRCIAWMRRHSSCGAACCPVHPGIRRRLAPPSGVGPAVVNTPHRPTTAARSTSAPGPPAWSWFQRCSPPSFRGSRTALQRAGVGPVAMLQLPGSRERRQRQPHHPPRTRACRPC